MPTFLHVHHVMGSCLPTKARRGHWTITGDCELLSVWALDTEPGSSARAEVHIAAEPSLESSKSSLCNTTIFPVCSYLPRIFLIDELIPSYKRIPILLSYELFNFFIRKINSIVEITTPKYIVMGK